MEGEMMWFLHKSASYGAVEETVRRRGNERPVGCGAVDPGYGVAGDIDRLCLRVTVPLRLRGGVNEWLHTEEPDTCQGYTQKLPHDITFTWPLGSRDVYTKRQ